MTPGRLLIFMRPRLFFSAACTVSFFRTRPRTGTVVQPHADEFAAVPTVEYRAWPPMCTSGSCGSSKSGIAFSEPSASR